MQRTPCRQREIISKLSDGPIKVKVSSSCSTSTPQLWLPLETLESPRSSDTGGRGVAGTYDSHDGRPIVSLVWPVRFKGEIKLDSEFPPKIFDKTDFHDDETTILL